MKKIIIAVSVLLLVAFVIIKVSSAQNSTQENKKTSSEAKMNCAKGPSVSCCAKMADSKTPGAKCMEGKGDSTNSKTCCSNMKTSMKDCDPARCTMKAKK